MPQTCIHSSLCQVLERVTRRTVFFLWVHDQGHLPPHSFLKMKSVSFCRDVVYSKSWEMLSTKDSITKSLHSLCTHPFKSVVLLSFIIEALSGAAGRLVSQDKFRIGPYKPLFYSFYGISSFTNLYWLQINIFVPCLIIEIALISFLTLSF